MKDETVIAIALIFTVAMITMASLIYCSKVR